MKSIVRKRFVPSHYHRGIYTKLQRLNQGSRSVEEYYQEMEMLMSRADIEEDREQTMARFLAGLNIDIANEVELHHYVELEEMVHMANIIEKQLRGGSNRSFKTAEKTPWKTPYKQREDK